MPDQLLDEFKNRVGARIFELLDPKDLALTSEVTEEDKARMRHRLEELVNHTLTRTAISREQREQLVNDLLSEMLGFGPLEPLLRDSTVTEIMVNGPREVYVERNGQLERVEVIFRHPGQLLYVIERILAPVGRRLTHAEPYVDARLPDGSRINVAIEPIAVGGPYVTIRKFSREIFSMEELVRRGTLTMEVGEFLRGCVQARLNLVLSGAASSGKTTLLNVLAGFISPKERVVIIEDTVEIQLQHHHVARLETRPPNVEGHLGITIRDLLRNAMRMRPDRILVGEVRGAEALDMLQAMNTGHDGSMTTLHANSPLDVLDRVQTMALMAPMELSHAAVARQVRSAIDLIVHLQRWPDGSRRVAHIAEVRKSLDANAEPLVDLFALDRTAGVPALRPTGSSPGFLTRFHEHGIKLPTGLFGAS